MKTVDEHTGLPDKLDTDVENLPGFSIDKVQIHCKPDKKSETAESLASMQGVNLHASPVLEWRISHDPSQIVQQKVGRVKPTATVVEIPIDDNVELENEADLMAGKVNKSSTDE